MLIKCPECGRELSDKATACPQCRWPVIRSARTQKLVPCSNCAYPIPTERNSCPSCGTAVEAEYLSEQGLSAQRQLSSLASNAVQREGGGFVGEVLRERNADSQCFSTVRLDSGEIVMVSIAGTEAKIFRMAANGTIPAETLWQADDVNNLPPGFEDPANPSRHPLELIRDVVLMCRDIADVQDLNGWSGGSKAAPYTSNRHVPLAWGIACIGIAALLLFSGARGWARAASYVLFLFGAFSLKTALFASDRQVREMTSREDRN